MKHEFKIGDRVIAVKAPDGKKSLLGKTGTIRGFCGVFLPVAVEFDVDETLHGCGDRVPSNHGWWCEKESLKLVKHRIVIDCDGRETTAKLFENDVPVKRARAMLSDEDTFDLDVGARVALDRLFDKKPVEEPAREGFKIGDRVALNEHEGTVICFPDDTTYVGVEFDKYGGYGHNCDLGHKLVAGAFGKSKRCGFYWPKDLKHLEKKKEEPEMKKSKFFPVKDIKAGYLLKVDNGDEVIYMTVVPNSRDVLGCADRDGENYWPVDRWCDDLTNKDDHDTKILAVYGLTANRWLMACDPDHRELLWERKDEPKKMTVAEVCKELGYDVEIVKE